MEFKLIFIAILLFILSCSTTSVYTDVYVEDFHSDDMESCRSSDVDLNNEEARQFFERSRQVEYRVIHDHYMVAPCYIEGVLKNKGKTCDWKIQASAIGSIRCDEETRYYVCDRCEDLFN